VRSSGSSVSALPSGSAISVGSVHLFVERAQAHVEPGHVEDLHQPLQVGQVEGVARVLLGDQQQVLRFGADFLARGHCRLHRQRQHLDRQVVEAAGKQVGVDRRELEAGVAHIDRGVERRRVLHPFEAEPAFDRRQRFEDALLEFVDRAGECGDEVGNHGGARNRAMDKLPRGCADRDILGIWGCTPAAQAPHRPAAHDEKGPPRGGPFDALARCGRACVRVRCGTRFRRGR